MIIVDSRDVDYSQDTRWRRIAVAVVAWLLQTVKNICTIARYLIIAAVCSVYIASIFQNTVRFRALEAQYHGLGEAYFWALEGLTICFVIWFCVVYEWAVRRWWRPRRTVDRTLDTIETWIIRVAGWKGLWNEHTYNRRKTSAR